MRDVIRRDLGSGLSAGERPVIADERVRGHIQLGDHLSMWIRLLAWMLANEEPSLPALLRVTPHGDAATPLLNRTGTEIPYL